MKKIAHNVHKLLRPVMSPLGNMALLSSQHLDITICTRRNRIFRAVGVEPAEYRVVIVKSTQHFHNAVVGLATETL